MKEGRSGADDLRDALAEIAMSEELRELPENTARRIVRATVTTSSDRRATLKKATSKVQPKTKIDFVRSVRGRAP